MSRYLNEEQLKTNLRIGKSIEQWLSSNNVGDYTIIKWIAVEKEKNGIYTLAYMESFDEGNKNFIDIYEFSTIDPDKPYGILNKFDSIDEALKFAKETYNASLDKYVSAGMIQEEYKSYFNSKRL